MTAEQKRRISSLESKFSNIQVQHLTMQKDEILYRQNDPSDSLYIVLNGLIELGHEKEEGSTPTRRIKEDEFFGLRDILENRRRSETAVTLDNSELLKIKLLDIDKNQTAAYYNELLKTKTVNDRSTLNTDSAPSNNLYSIRKVNDKNIISFLGLHGNLSNAVFFKDVLFTQINDGNKNLIIDLLACKTIDSTFIGTLIAALKKVSELEGSLKLVCGANLCSWLFIITKMDRVFNIYGSVEEAVARE
jgi:anti-anti-sigma factor